MFKIELSSLEAYRTLKVVLGNDSYYADLHYFCLDNTFFGAEQNAPKGFLNFASMIESWKLKIKKIQINKSDYLPFDYSDQYIGFFLISRINEEDIAIQYAITTEYQGWGINPSQLYLETFIDKPYELDGEKYTMPIHQLLLDMEGSMSTILSGFYKKDF